MSLFNGNCHIVARHDKSESVSMDIKGSSWDVLLLMTTEVNQIADSMGISTDKLLEYMREIAPELLKIEAGAIIVSPNGFPAKEQSDG